MLRIYARRVREKKEQHNAAVRLAVYAVLRAGGRAPVEFEKNSHGKPYLSGANGGLYVNWSHSGEYVLCAVSDREVGVDIQENGREPGASLIRRFLRPEERALFDRAPEEEKKSLFYRYWTVKESFVKAAGTGFAAGVSGFYVRMDGKDPAICRAAGEKTYACRMLPFRDGGYTAAICMEEAVEAADIEYVSEEVGQDDSYGNFETVGG